jgi:signal transduction histidine kinase
VVQEALHNVEKHSHARRVEIHLNARAGNLHLHIADDGSGFASEKETRMGLGMANMKERVVAIGGTISISSTPMQGTCIDVSVPFESVA